jgi:hypothetical protein
MLNTDVDAISYHGTTLYNSGEQYLFTTYSGALETRGTTFDTCGEVFPSSGIMEYCNFINAPNYALHMIPDNRVAYCSFINCPSGIHITQSGSYNFNNLSFTGGVYDIINESNGHVIVNAIDSNPTTYFNIGSSTTEIKNSVFITVDVEDENGNAVNNAYVYVKTIPSGLQLMKELTVGGQAVEPYNYTGNENIEVYVRKSSPGSTRYLPYKTTGTIDDGGFTLNAVIIEDTIVDDTN